MIKLPLWVTAWALYLAVKIPTWLAGFVVTPFLWGFRHTKYEDLKAWTKPWANPEDWEGHGNGSSSLPAWWVAKEGEGFKSFYRYHAIRNPANGLRSFDLLGLDIIPDKVRFKTKTQLVRYEPSTLRYMGHRSGWYFAWQGLRAGFKYVRVWNDERHFVIKFGWRVEPSDATGAGPSDDNSFATKLLPYRKG